MKNRAGLLLAGLSATILLAFAVSTASALRSISIVGETTATAQGRISFIGGGSTLECNITLVRTLSRSIPKTAGILLGAIIDIRIALREAGCRSSAGTLTAFTILGLGTGELWRLFYESFDGTLPNITAINKIIKNWLWSDTITVPIFGSITCLYEEEEGRRGGQAKESLTREGRLEKFRIGANRSSRVRGSGLCPERGELSGELTFTREAPSIRLI